MSVGCKADRPTAAKERRLPLSARSLRSSSMTDWMARCDLCEMGVGWGLVYVGRSQSLYLGLILGICDLLTGASNSSVEAGGVFPSS